MRFLPAIVTAKGESIGGIQRRSSPGLPRFPVSMLIISETWKQTTV